MVKYFVSQSCSVTAAKTPGGFFLSMWVFTPGFYPDHVLDVVCVCVYMYVCIVLMFLAQQILWCIG